MARSAEEEILDVARTFLIAKASDPEHAAITVPELQAASEILSQAFRDTGYEFETVIESLRITELTGETASVHAVQRLVPRGRRGEEQTQEVAVQLVKRDGWKVRDYLIDGRSFVARLHPVLVEPAAAEGISVRGWARTDPGGKVLVAFVVRNDSRGAWRIKCAGAASQKGRMWFLSQAFWKLLFIGNYATFPPGAERGVLLTAPANVEVVWLKASRFGGLRSPLFALSWESARVAAAAIPFKWDRHLLRHVASHAFPFVGLAVALSVVISPRAALVGSALFSAAIVLDTHWCLFRLKRKLARFRALTAA